MKGCSLVLGFRDVLISTSNGWKIPKSPKIDELWQLRDYYIKKCLKFSKDLFFPLLLLERT
jgi:hypothetical protein